MFSREAKRARDKRQETETESCRWRAYYLEVRGEQRRIHWLMAFQMRQRLRFSDRQSAGNEIRKSAVLGTNKQQQTDIQDRQTESEWR